VRKQIEVGVDVVNDGEVGKSGYTVYVKERLTGFDGEEPPPGAADFPAYYASRTHQRRGVRRPTCTGPVAWKDRDAVDRDISNLTAALNGTSPEEVFMTAASPGNVANYHKDRYYGDEETYLLAVADALKEEYDAIHRAGFLLQLDCPDLTGRTRKTVELGVEVLNYALRDIPSDRMRLHVCWGNYQGPHHLDVPLEEIIELLLTARPSGLSIEGANPRHEHEWNVFERVNLPDGKVLIPGVLDSTSNYVEHPELVAQRLVRYAQVVGRENIIAGTDCGFGTNVSDTPLVDGAIAWAKLRAMAEGARLASEELW
jgi:5-methyltetrahydropteroyltriglutamate--homocysteine methyltransferase